MDTHAHLEEIADPEGAIGRAVAAGVRAIIAVGSDAGSNRRTLELARLFPGLVFPALGLHPWELASAPEEVGTSLGALEEGMDEAVAVGEVGLDYHKELLKQVDKERQQRVLRAVLSLAARFKKPVLVHSRYAWRDALELVQAAGVKAAVFHWFTGPSGVLRELVAEGYYISATPALAYHPEHRRAVRECPLERLLLETDSPVVYRDSPRPSEPADVLLVARLVAEVKGLPLERVAQVTTGNALALFGLDKLGEEMGRV